MSEDKPVGHALEQGNHIVRADDEQGKVVTFDREARLLAENALLIAQRDFLIKAAANLRGALDNTVALIEGKCPALLDLDRGASLADIEAINWAVAMHEAVKTVLDDDHDGQDNSR